MTELLYFHAITERNGVFVNVEGREPCPVEELKGYLSRHYRKQAARQVELFDCTFRSEVWVPESDSDELCYVLADLGGNPPSAEKEKTSSAVDYMKLLKYFESLTPFLRRSEFVAPECPGSEWTTFLEPRLSSDAPEGGQQVSWEKFLGTPRAVLLGPPGCGKTTILRRIALNYTHQEDQGVIPLYVQCRSFPANLSLRQCVELELVRNELPSVAGSLDSHVASGRLFLLIDGIDEVEAPRADEIIRQLAEWSEEASRLRVIVSSRPFAYRNKLQSFLHVYVRPFRERQVCEWAYHRLEGDSSWREFVAYLWASPNIKELSRRPLLLAIGEQVYRRSGKRQLSSGAFMEACLLSLVETWDSSRGISRTRSPWATSQRKVATLCRSAHQVLQGEHTTFSREQFSQWEGPYWAKSDVDFVLHRLCDETGLIESADKDRWGFREAAFVEYLAAKHLVESTDEVAELMSKRTNEPAWGEVWIHACSITHDSTPLVSRLYSSAVLPRERMIVLALGALSADATLSSDAAEQVVESTAKWLESTLRSIKLVEKAGDEALWSWHLAGRSLSERKVVALSSAVRAIKSCHGGQFSALLNERLNRSNLPAVSALAGLSEFVGVYSSSADIDNGIFYASIREVEPGHGADDSVLARPAKALEDRESLARNSFEFRVSRMLRGIFGVRFYNHYFAEVEGDYIEELYETRRSESSEGSAGVPWYAEVRFLMTAFIIVFQVSFLTLTGRNKAK